MRILALFMLFISLPAATQARVTQAEVYSVGLASIDLTPSHPVRLNGFGGRKSEHDGVVQPIHAKAMAIGDDPLVLITVDVLGIPDAIRQDLAKRLKIKPERLCITATHTHTAPMLTDQNITMFGTAITAAEQTHIDDYTKSFTDKLQAVAEQALKDRQPSTLHWGIGRVGFSINRRVKNGPVDHDLPVLFVKDAKGKVRGVCVSYACHCVTLSLNKISGDWAGFAQEAVESDFPGAVCLHSVGCGAENNPDSGVTGDKVDVAKAQGKMIAAEVKRLAGGFLAPIQGKLIATESSIDLPLAAHPTRQEWEQKAQKKDAVGYHAQVQLKRLDAGEKLRTAIKYPMVSWRFGESLCMVFMAGEVVADFSLQLKKDFDRTRLWVHGYANDAPCYIPSERVLKLASYEGAGAMIYYDQPAAFAPGLEAKILKQAGDLIGPAFRNNFDPKKIGPSPPLSPQQSVSTLIAKPGFHVELMAAEPMVESPVAIAFGADRKLWVAEMSDYPNGKAGHFEPGGRVRVLDWDGERFARSTVFLKDIPFPTGVLPWRGGVLVCSAPDILFAECTDGTGVANRVTKLYSGFGTGNYQARVNSLQYGLDGWVYGSCGLFGGDITCHKTGQVVKLGDRDFRIKPDEGLLEPASGRSQQGRVRDDWDNWFGCDNSNLIWHYPLPDHYLRRNPHATYPPAAVPVTDRRVFPAGGIQLFALSGPPGLATAACGLGIYRDDAFGPEYTGNAFICEPVNQVVTRRILRPKDSTFTGVRAKDEQDREFLAGTDPWFRPVQATTGPDGALWVVDMHRHVIEHPRWIPPQELAKVDVRAGAGLGRIYRVVKGEARAWQRVETDDALELALALDSPNGWQRDIVMKQFEWQEANESKISRLKQQLNASRPETRFHSLCIMKNQKAIEEWRLQFKLIDTHQGIQRHALRIAEDYINNSSQAVANVERAMSADAQVKLQLAFILGSTPRELLFEKMVDLAVNSPDDLYLHAAIASSLNMKNLIPIMKSLLAKSGKKNPPISLIRAIASTAACEQNSENDFAFVSLIVEAPKMATWPWISMASFLEARPQIESMSRSSSDAIHAMLSEARRAVLDPSSDLQRRQLLLNVLARVPGEPDYDPILKLLQPQEPAALQSAALTALARTKDAKLLNDLLAKWPLLTPSLRSQALDILLSRPEWTRALLAAMQAGTLPPAALDAARRDRLRHHADAKIAALAGTLFEAGNPDRRKVLDDYQTALTMKGDEAKGKAIFAKTCAACHKLNGVGHDVGPDLAALKTKTKAYLLGEILDPNRNLDSRYVEYTANLADGRGLVGVLASETAGSILLKSAEGKEHSILRRDLDSLKGSGKSLMPEGLEKDLPPAAMADLLAYMTTK